MGRTVELERLRFTFEDFFRMGEAAVLDDFGIKAQTYARHGYCGMRLLRRERLLLAIAMGAWSSLRC